MSDDSNSLAHLKEKSFASGFRFALPRGCASAYTRKSLTQLSLADDQDDYPQSLTGGPTASESSNSVSSRAAAED